MQVIAEAAAAKAQPSLERAAARRAARRRQARRRDPSPQQRRHEAVAGADGVDDLDRGRRDLDAARRRAWRARPVAERRTQKRGPDLRPGREGVLDRAAGIEPFEVLLARLDEMGERDLPLDQRRHRLAVRRHQRADVGIEAGGGVRARRLQRLDDALAVARIDGGDRADVQVAAPSGQIAGNGQAPSNAVASR